MREEFDQRLDDYQELWERRAEGLRAKGFGVKELGVRGWEELQAEVKDIHVDEYTTEATKMRLLVLAHVIHRAIVVQSDEDSSTSKKQTMSGIYLPLLNEQDRGRICPLSMAYSSQSRFFSALVTHLDQENKKTFNQLPNPPLLPLFVDGKLLAVPFRGLSSGHMSPDEEVRAWIRCLDKVQARGFLLDGVREKLRKKVDLFETVSIAIMDAVASADHEFAILLRRHLILAEHFYYSALSHGSRDFAVMEMGQYVLEHRPWNQISDTSLIQGVRKHFSKPHEGTIKPPSNQAEFAADRQFHLMMAVASCISLEHLDKALEIVEETDSRHKSLVSRIQKMKGKKTPDSQARTPSGADPTPPGTL
mmetsp:Transcript_19495/g.30513  ORF Transcript_19495/g.30513 Transcript_19495/m.30513 type:complete len:363 (-) Transcript_19495:184-1272(-)|eukprot:CAMPEP_0184302874 /NCGR_PEP_ID=MMETSP1049-20130417/12738_1 /TAXON_ID=77928 /ORGANISM="Proteomonas sulcata, Strain CCMP704" /LENGTH=362 /DNA_ID=CAMNT_0026614267 /DNA_START=143 /DNA_END=1231 /DNA_ORIENTATION=+